MAVPSLIFALLLLAMFGTSVTSMSAGHRSDRGDTHVSAGARARAQQRRGRTTSRRRGCGARGLAWLMRPRDLAQSAAAPLIAEFGLRFCFVFLFISGAQFPRAGYPAADGRLGIDGARQRLADHLW